MEGANGAPPQHPMSFSARSGSQDADIDESAGPGWTVSRVELVPGHVRMWRLDRDDDYARTELDWGI